MNKKYIIGIDLGTTNSTVSYALMGEGDKSIYPFAIPQIIASGMQGEELSLPSFIYLPLETEVKAKIAAVEWAKERDYCVGKFARDRGGAVPDHLIASAKSWICHASIDRRSRILPINHENLECKISPLEACARQLQHIKESWNYKMLGGIFEDQQIFITVPASFDPAARQLIQEAAEIAGYPEIVLLEEPQAAFYAWLYHQEEEWRKKLEVGDRILVVDIGGGTSDFSLISVAEKQGELSLERIAVGSHLLLGGDNIDLTLAYLVKSKLEAQGHEIEDWQLNALQFACRKAKEVLLSEDSPETFDITVMGRGSGLIGGALAATVTKDEVEALILDGFFPQEDYATPLLETKSGIQQFGLPFAEDPRITCQLAKFLSTTRELELKEQNIIMPTAVLYNGGTMKSSALRQRILQTLNSWADQLNVPQLKTLEDENLDFAVSQGAVFYGLVRQGGGVRIKSGTSRSYYIGVEDAVPAIPGLERPMQAICVVPFGMEEGEEKTLEDKQFSLILGKKAQFRFFSYATCTLPDGLIPQPGFVIKNWKKHLLELPSIETILENEKEDFKSVSVKLNSRVTELGFLELWFEAVDGRKWKLEFNIRD